MRRAELLLDSMIVVTRYFGGTKAWEGGLVRAYGGSAGEVIAQVQLEQLIEKDTWTISMQYSDQSLIKSIINSQRGEILERYTHEVYLEVLIDPMIRKQFQKICADRTAGRVRPVVVGTDWVVNRQ